MNPQNVIRPRAQEDAIVSSSSSQQGKRAACDRCRGQKLRCLRDSQSGSEKCNRCISADAICSFSVSKRAGRPPSNNTFSTERKEKRKSSQDENPSTRVSDNRNNQSRFNSNPQESRFGHQAGDNVKGMPFGRSLVERNFGIEIGQSTPTDEPLEKSTPSSIRETESNSNQESLAFPTYRNHSNGSLPWTDDGTMPLYDVGDLTELETFGSDYEWPFSQIQTQSINIQSGLSSRDEKPIQNNSLGENTVSMHLRQLNVQMYDSTRTLDSPSEFRHREQQRSVKFSAPFTPMSTSEKDCNELVGSLSDKSVIVEEVVQRRRTQQLLELGMNLSSQLTANEIHRHHSQESSGLEDQSVGKVLRNSIAFLNILTSFYPTTRPTASCSISTSSKEGDVSPSKISDCSDPALEASACEGDVKPLPADMTTIVQLLSCYIRIIHMHGILYTRIYDYLTAQPQKTSQLPPVFPGMQVDGVLLDAFGRFQVKLVLQISTHILGEIEMALGLPDGYRIGKRTTQTHGILERSVSLQFVEMAMRENSRTGLGMEKDRVSSIKDTLASLRQLLKGAINI